MFVKGKLSYRISSEDAFAKKASERLINKSNEEIKSLTAECIEDSIRNVFLVMAESETRSNNGFSELTKTKIEEALNPVEMVSNHFRIEVN